MVVKESLFDFLFSSKLLSNESTWISTLTVKKKSVLRITFVTDYNAFDKLYNHVFKQVIILFSKLLWLSTLPPLKWIQSTLS